MTWIRQENYNTSAAAMDRSLQAGQARGGGAQQRTQCKEEGPSWPQAGNFEISVLHD